VKIALEVYFHYLEKLIAKTSENPFTGYEHLFGTKSCRPNLFCPPTPMRTDTESRIQSTKQMSSKRALAKKNNHTWSTHSRTSLRRRSVFELGDLVSKALVRHFHFLDASPVSVYGAVQQVQEWRGDGLGDVAHVLTVHRRVVQLGEHAVLTRPVRNRTKGRLLIVRLKSVHSTPFCPRAT